MERIVNTALVMLGLFVWMYQKYGLMSLVTQNFAKHAGVGRAKHDWFWNLPVRDHRQGTNVSDILSRLRAERSVDSYAPVAYALAA